MTNGLLFALTLIAALGCGLIAGVFFAFSNFVMEALARLPAPHGIAAMKSINVVVINPLFLTALFGTGAICLVLAIVSLVRWHTPGAAYVLVGSLLYLIGTVGVTMVCNVPRNNALAAVTPDSAEGASVWTRYVTEWTMWNTVRTVAALVASALLIVALR
jgi:uncharacterized membrane protein